MREIRDHVVNPANDVLKIIVTDQPGSGGANHAYEISGFDLSTNRSADHPEYGQIAAGMATKMELVFQNGPINEVGVNGITHEVLIAILLDRMRAFQRGPFACRENALAVTKLEEAQHWLAHRTNRRVAEGSEGTHKPDA